MMERARRSGYNKKPRTTSSTAPSLAACADCPTGKPTSEYSTGWRSTACDRSAIMSVGAPSSVLITSRLACGSTFLTPLDLFFTLKTHICAHRLIQVAAERSDLYDGGLAESSTRTTAARLRPPRRRLVLPLLLRSRGATVQKVLRSKAGLGTMRPGDAIPTP
jgi:hypothetical protein